jgi:hypothetical protein
MAIISNGTTIASGGSLSVSANPPSTGGVVGSYLFARCVPAVNKDLGDTLSGSDIRPCNAQGGPTGTAPSGTWRMMGRVNGDNNASSSTSFIRIS